MRAGSILALCVGLGVAVPVAAESEIAAGALRGTMRRPTRRAPVVLVVPGSGATNRDGNNPEMGFVAAPYRLLARALARKGIATVRVDKRGMFGSAGAGDPNAVTVDVYAADIRAWIDVIRRRTGKRCVWLLGHSEGSLMVSAATRGRTDVCGLLLVAGPGRKMGDVIFSQLAANPLNAPFLAAAAAIIAELEAGRHVDVTDAEPSLRRIFDPRLQGFLISLFAADPPALAAGARVPTLVLQGSTDLQISVDDAHLLARALGTQPVVLEGVNHVLKTAPLDPAANLATYFDPDLPLAPGLARAIVRFVRTRGHTLPGAPAP